MTTQSPFTYTHRIVIERMRKALGRQLCRPVTVEYGRPAEGLVFDASFRIEDARGRARKPLASILTGPGIGGDGYSVLAADGTPLANGIRFHVAAQMAGFAASRLSHIATADLKFGPSPAVLTRDHRKPASRNN